MNSDPILDFLNMQPPKPKPKCSRSQTQSFFPHLFELEVRILMRSRKISRQKAEALLKK